MRERKLAVLILKAIASRPEGILGLSLWNRIRKHLDGFTVHEFDDSLRTMRNAGRIVCTNKRWWITDRTQKNWHEVEKEATDVKCA